MPFALIATVSAVFAHVMSRYSQRLLVENILHLPVESKLRGITAGLYASRWIASGALGGRASYKPAVDFNLGAIILCACRIAERHSQLAFLTKEAPASKS